MHQVGYLQEIFRDSRSTEHKNGEFILEISVHKNGGFILEISVHKNGEFIL